MRSTAIAAIALQDIALFVEVARGRSFTRASETLSVPNATLSRRIAVLEQRVGVRLLERSTRRVELTEVGKRYFERCERVVEEASIAHQMLKETVERPAGHLRISMPVDFGLAYVAPIVEEFARYYPEITMELELSPRHADFVAGRVDVALRLGEVKQEQLVARSLGHVARALYASPAYLALRGAPVRPTDLREHDCILMSNQRHPSRWRLVRGTRAVDVSVQGRFSTNSVAMMQRLAEQGYGIAGLAPALVRAAYDAGRLKPVLEDWECERMPVRALTASRLVPARVRTFVDFLASRLAG
jgi:DNA-binding transcriptional LysR family regulator